MRVTKICKMCGMEFEGKTNACYCCGSCRTLYHTQYARKWRDKNREKYREYMRNYSKIGKAKMLNKSQTTGKVEVINNEKYSS